jgi:hypothetical protein
LIVWRRKAEGRGSDGTGDSTPAPSAPSSAPAPRGTVWFPVLAPFLFLTFALCGPGPRAQQPRAPEPRVVPPRPTAVADPAADRAFLDDLEQRTFRWFWDLADPTTQLIPDRAPTPSFSSVAAVGFGLTAYTVGAERGWVTREEAARRVAATLRFLADAPAGDAANGRTSYRGFFYHFLDMHTGARFEHVELSTVDTALLMAGALECQSYFDRDDPVEARIRADADFLYRRIEWDWASPRPPAVSMGWTPEEGFHAWDWHGYDEAMIVYLLALGSPTHPIDPKAWDVWTSTYKWGTFQGQEHLNFSPLFVHQFSHVWVDFRGIQDAYMRGKGIDYFENARRATLSQRAYAIANPGGFAGYGPDVWGLTACDGPLDAVLEVGGRSHKFQTYAARGASIVYVLDDGTIAPTAAAGSIAFAPEIVVPALREMARRWGSDVWNAYGFIDAFNPTLGGSSVVPRYGRIVPGVGWFGPDQIGIDQGPIVAMLENHRSELVWKTMRRNPYIVAGLKRAGFTGGWLETPAH